MKCLDCKHLNRTQCPAAFINIDGCGESERNFIGYVMWNKVEFVLSKNQEKPEYENETEIIPHLSWGHSFEIIGNIHDGEKRT